MNSIRIFRIVKSRYAESAFDGEGAKVYGGRWNQVGFSAVYASESLALAALEMFVQLDNIPHFNLVSILAHIPSTLEIETLSKLPNHWDSYPISAGVQDCGTQWLINQRTAVLKVPSVIIPSEFNYLLNPAHTDFQKIKIDKPMPFSFDQRLVKKLF